MRAEIKVPTMGESISEATIGAILKSSGSKVAIDEEILELETDKVNQVLHAPESGVLTLSVQSGDTVKVGQVIAFVEEGEGKEAPKKQEADAPKKAEEKPSQKTEEKKEPPEDKSEKKAPPQQETPTSRKTKEAFLKELEAKRPALEQTKPFGPAEMEASSNELSRETRRPMTKIRRIIASRLLEVSQTTAMLTTFNEVDLSVVINLREKYKETFAKEYGTKLGFMSFFVKASVSALAAFPNVNSYISNEDLVHREYYDIGIAVGTDRGLIVPVLKGCEALSFSEIEKKLGEYADQARKGTIPAEALQGGGFTITNGGVYGSLLSTPILNPSQSAILGMHKIQKRPVVVDDQIVIRPMMYLALSYDHRVIDGKEAVSFLLHIKDVLEDPSRLLLEVS